MAAKNLNPVTSIMDFKTFAKNPIVATLFLVLIAISYLYIDVRSTFKEQISSQESNCSYIVFGVNSNILFVYRCKVYIQRTNIFSE
jgi:hypothetical protein